MARDSRPTTDAPTRSQLALTVHVRDLTCSLWQAGRAICHRAIFACLSDRPTTITHTLFSFSMISSSSSQSPSSSSSVYELMASSVPHDYFEFVCGRWEEEMGAVKNESATSSVSLITMFRKCVCVSMCVLYAEGEREREMDDSHFVCPVESRQTFVCVCVCVCVCV